METKDLIRLRKLLNKELKRRERIKELESNNDVIEYLNLMGITKKNTDEKLDNQEYVLKEILKKFKVLDTNGIYVCTKAFYTTYSISYEDTETVSIETDIDSKHAAFKIYTDIESLGHIIASRDGNEYHQNTIEDFESENIVLNPSNSNKNSNGFQEVRYDFFDSCLRNGQKKGKEIILRKYSRL